MAELLDLPRGATDLPKEGVKGLTNWTGLSKFVESFPDPISALIGIGIICFSVIALALGTVAIICSMILARQRTRSRTDIELARLGVYRDQGRSRVMEILGIALLVLIMCGVAFISIWLISSKAKADYAAALHFTRGYVRSADEVLLDLPDEIRESLLKLSKHIDDRRLAVSLSKHVSKVASQSYPGVPEGYHKLVEPMEHYIVALSYYDHFRGGRVRDLLLEGDVRPAVIIWLFDWINEHEPRSGRSFG
jgi:hypothetical protein